MDFTFYNVAAAITFFILYAVSAILVGSGFYRQLGSESVVGSDDVSTIESHENIRLMHVYRGEIATFFALVWPIAVIFLLSVDLGNSIYNSFIYNGNEEDRIASWLF